jgi:hypothetical protein
MVVLGLAWLPIFDVHGGEAGHGPFRPPAGTAVTVFPQASHAGAAAHFEASAGVERPACGACLQSVRSASAIPAETSTRLAPAAEADSPVRRWSFPRSSGRRPQSDRAPPAA